MIVCYNIPEIWQMMDVICIFHFEILFAFLQKNSPKKLKFDKNLT